MALVCAGLSLTCPQAWSLHADFTRSIDVAIHGDYVTVLAHDAPVRNILEELARHLNLVVEAHAPLDEYISLEIRGEPPPTVIRRLLRDYSFTLQYFPVTDAGVAAQRPGRLWIHPQNEQNSGEVKIITWFGATQTDDTKSAIDRIASVKPAVRLDSIAVLTAFGDDDAFTTLTAAMNDVIIAASFVKIIPTLFETLPWAMRYMIDGTGMKTTGTTITSTTIPRPFMWDFRVRER